jgi:two-component system, chemotaxis family, sensor kinase CheA
MEDDQDVIREFLIESNENLSRLDQDLVELETRPQDAELLASVFRTIHTIKGTCGFLGFSTLERITHQAESLLSQLREGRRKLEPGLVSLILETVDAVRKVLGSIESTGKEGPEPFTPLAERLRETAEQCGKGPIAPARTPALRPGLEPAVEAALAVLPDAEKPAEAAGKHAAADGNIRVGAALLDKLMDLVGELVLIRNQILQFTAERDDLVLSATSQRLNLITTELQEGVMKTRMQPIGVIWNKLPRVVRDLSVGLGKQIRLEMDGAETELDRTIIEAIKDPLVHLVRNSCDHGIESAEARQKSGKPFQGTLLLRAFHEGGQVNIEISDDGAGMDPAVIRQKALEQGILPPEMAQRINDRESLNLIFRPGFSTAASVSNISGRGVGMDVVKTHIEKIGGTVDVSSKLGEGTTVKLRIPLTLAIIPGLVVTSGGERFVIPQVSLLELILLEGDSAERHIEFVHGTPVYRRRGKLLPISYLNQVVGLESERRGDALSIVVLQAEDRQYGLVVDSISDTQEIVVKPLGKQLKGLSLYAGATIMGDGRVALILDVQGIGQASGVLEETKEQAHGAAEGAERAEVEQHRLLLFSSGVYERIAIPLQLVARLEEFPRSSIERAGDAMVVQYRQRILPLVVLKNLLESGESHAMSTADPAQVIVFDDGDQRVGIVVDQILDIAEQAITVRQKSTRKGFLGSGVVGARVADFLDVDYVLEATAARWFQGSGASSKEKTVLIADRSAFARGLMRGALEMSGYAVIEAGNLDEAISGMEKHAVDAVLVADDLPPGGAAAVVEAMRRRPEWELIPVMEVEAWEKRRGAHAAQAGSLQANGASTERGGILEFLATLPEQAQPELVGAVPGSKV